MTNVVGYARVSTTEQGEVGLGLHAQRAAIEHACDQRGWELRRVEDDVLSGRTLARDGLDRALAAVRAGEASGLVVAKLDRLSRSVVDFGRLLQEATNAGWNIVALDFGLDLSTPQGKLVGNVLMSVAEWEREIIGVRTRDALAVKRASGVKLGRPKSLPDDVRSRIARMRSGGVSLATIAAQLNAEQVPTAQGGKRWYPSSVRAVLRAA